MDVDEQRDYAEEQYWANFCPECGGPCEGAGAHDGDRDDADLIEEQLREREEAAADSAQAAAEDEGAKVPATYGAGIVVPCTCGRSDDDPYDHDEMCGGSVAVADRAASIACVGIVDGTLTQAERNLIVGVEYIIRGRLGQLGGENHDIDLGALGRRMIRDAAAEICGEEAGR